jgi:hypothetical protein
MLHRLSSSYCQRPRVQWTSVEQVIWPRPGEKTASLTDTLALPPLELPLEPLIVLPVLLVLVVARASKAGGIVATVKGEAGRQPKPRSHRRAMLIRIACHPGAGG